MGSLSSAAGSSAADADLGLAERVEEGLGATRAMGGEPACGVSARSWRRPSGPLTGPQSAQHLA